MCVFVRVCVCVCALDKLYISLFLDNILRFQSLVFINSYRKTDHYKENGQTCLPMR